jgi:ABC-type branched-subunit amino acid transport system substrate-binding protein
MIRTRRARLAAAAACLALLAAACGDDDDAGGDDTTDTTAAPDDGGDDTTDTTAAPDDGGEDDGGDEGAFAVDTADCPAEATEPIEGTISIGTTLPLSGGAAAAAFAPVAAGIQGYIDFANAEGLVPGYTLEIAIEDDQFNPSLTTPAVERLIDEVGVNLFTAQIGTANNLAVRDLLNEECYPQLFTNTGAPVWGDVENYPWTIGALAPYNTETAIYVEDMTREFPDGATAAVFHVNSEFGLSYANAFEELVGDAGIEVQTTQTVENADNNPPASQIAAIASGRPDVILAVPLGAQCPAFLSELANAKAANAGWEPRVYITNTCASTLLLSIAGANADGIITSTAVKDANDPANESDPAVAEYRAALDATGLDFGGDYATAYAGWVLGELTVDVLQRAAESADGLTRASILNAARVTEYVPSLARDGVVFTLNGAEDPYMVESLQVVEYDADTTSYTDVGELVTTFEGQTEFTE